jgi:16S rRNA (cytidine1402-2'-O)-methyltransferase
VSASGLPSDRFVFEGFLPAKGQDRQNRLEALVVETRAIVLYESPHRLRETLQDLAKTLGGDRAAVLGRELTKLHEQFWRGTLNEAIAYYESEVQPQGEFTLVMAPGDREEPILSPEAIKAELQALLDRGISRSQASRQLAKNTALSRRDIYQIALSLETD